MLAAFGSEGVGIYLLYLLKILRLSPTT